MEPFECVGLNYIIFLLPFGNFAVYKIILITNSSTEIHYTPVVFKNPDILLIII